MTSRETTSLLPLAAERVGRTALETAAVLAFGAIQWPWLLRSLWGGSAVERERLQARLGLDAAALPHLGSWKADAGFLNLLVDRIERDRPETVVELGAGASSLVIGRALQLHGGGRLVSYDQHAGFVAATAAWLADNGIAADLRHAPLAPAPAGWPTEWYALADLPAAIDLLVVDGPPWTLHPLVRGAAETLFDQVSPGGTVLLDDAARPGERVVARIWRRRWPEFRWRLLPGIKGTLEGVRLR